MIQINNLILYCPSKKKIFSIKKKLFSLERYESTQAFPFLKDNLENLENLMIKSFFSVFIKYKLKNLPRSTSELK